MAKKAVAKKPKLEDIELHPDAWNRFERFVKTSVRKPSAPKPKSTPSRAKPAIAKRRRKT
jgi:hypothetical protein